MRLEFLPEALQDIDRLYDFLIEKDPIAAQKAMLAIDEGLLLLEENPLLGLEVESATRYRQLFVPFGRSAYVLRYRVDTERNALVVVRVWHGREDRGEGRLP